MAIPCPDTEPGDDLLDLVHDHVRTLLALADALTSTRASAERTERLAALAVAALATGQAVSDLLTVERWSLVRDALSYGAPAEHVGKALGDLEPDEVLAGVASWAQREYQAGRLSADEYVAASDLAAGHARTF